jgi:hypothetical protein
MVPVVFRTGREGCTGLSVRAAQPGRGMDKAGCEAPARASRGAVKGPCGTEHGARKPASCGAGPRHRRASRPAAARQADRTGWQAPGFVALAAWCGPMGRAPDTVAAGFPAVPPTLVASPVLVTKPARQPPGGAAVTSGLLRQWPVTDGIRRPAGPPGQGLGDQAAGRCRPRLAGSAGRAGSGSPGGPAPDGPGSLAPPAGLFRQRPFQPERLSCPDRLSWPDRLGRLARLGWPDWCRTGQVRWTRREIPGSAGGPLARDTWLARLDHRLGRKPRWAAALDGRPGLAGWLGHDGWPDGRAGRVEGLAGPARRPGWLGRPGEVCRPDWARARTAGPPAAPQAGAGPAGPGGPGTGRRDRAPGPAGQGLRVAALAARRRVATTASGQPGARCAHDSSPQEASLVSHHGARTGEQD